LSQTLSGLDYLTGTDFCDNYNSLLYDKALNESERQELNLANRKLSIIVEQQQYLNNCLLELFFLILYKIDQGELSKSHFELAYKIYSTENVKTQYYKNNDLSGLDWQIYNRYETGAQFIKPFNYYKYRLLILLYEYIETQNVSLDKLEKEMFSTSSKISFSVVLEKFDEKFVNKYFDFYIKDLKEFKSEAKLEIERKLGKIKKGKAEYIINTPLKKEYIDQFEKDCKDAWKQGNNELEKFLKREQIETKPETSNFFGQYFLFEKKWLIDPFENDVSFGRDSGIHYGRGQAQNKLKFILKSIYEKFDEKIDEEFILKDISSELLPLIEEHKEYFLFYNHWELIQEIPNLNWVDQGIIRASLSVKNSRINFCFTNAPLMMMFEKDAFILKQHKGGYDDINDELVVEINEIKEDKEIQQIIKDDNRYQASDDVKQMAKIRIAERFEVVRNPKKPNSKLIKLKI
jgi:hypothetical protein